MRAGESGIDAAMDTRTAYVAEQASTGVEAQFTATRQLGATEGRITYATRAERVGAVGLDGDVFIESDTKWLYVYDGSTWHYDAGINSGSFAAMGGISLTSEDEGAWFFVTTAGANYGLWRVTGVSFVKQLLPASPDVATEYRINGQKVVGARGAAIADPAGGATVDAEARAAIVAILTQMRSDGKIA